MEIVRELDTHPIPFEQDQIDEIWADDEMLEGNPPSVDEAHEEYTRTIAEYGEWYVFRCSYPFEVSGVIFWNKSVGEAFVVYEMEGEWHHLVNLFAEIVDEEGDCRDADYSSGVRQSGSVEQRCEECGGRWTVG